MYKPTVLRRREEILFYRPSGGVGRTKKAGRLCRREAARGSLRGTPLSAPYRGLREAVGVKKPGGDDFLVIPLSADVAVATQNRPQSWLNGTAGGSNAPVTAVWLRFRLAEVLAAWLRNIIAGNKCRCVSAKKLYIKRRFKFRDCLERKVLFTLQQ